MSNGYGVFSGVLSGVCDVLFALLPWYLVGGLRMKRKEKMRLVSWKCETILIEDGQL